MQALYHAGRSTAPVPVTVRAEPNGLLVSGPGELAALWPYQQVRHTQGFQPGQPVRLEKVEGFAEALVFPDPQVLQAVAGFYPGGIRQGQSATGRWIRPLAASVVLSIAALLVVLYKWGLPVLGTAAAAVVPVSVEERVGRLTAASLAPPETRCTNPALSGPVEEIVRTLAAAAPPSPYYRFQVVVAEGELVNAFAAPGGHIVVFRELIEKTRAPEELAGVLAHEMQHVLGRHTTRMVFRSLAWQALLAALLGDTGTVLVNLAGVLGDLQFGRADEHEADLEGMRMLQRARVDPQGMIRFFDNLEAGAAQMPRLAQYLSTHPRTEDRLERLRRLASQGRYSPAPLLPGQDWAAIAAARCRP